MPYIYGRNPVISALEQEDAVQKIYVQHGLQGNKIRHIYRIARAQNISITNADARKLKQLAGNGNHQGIVALIAPVEILPLEALLDLVTWRQNTEGEHNIPPSIVVLDRLQDPHNMGAIIRSAEIFSVEGVLFSDRENVPVTDTVVKASAGAAMHCPLYKADSLSRAVEQLKENGVWIYGTSLEGSKSLWEMDFRRPCAIIIGNEEKGLRPLLQKKCDELFYIPQSGKTQSLNASVAAGIVLAEITRQRQI